jgi:hypothetical protein
MPRKKSDEHAREGFFSVYMDYGRVLRAWLVAYGAGGPVLFLTQKDIADRIRASGEARTIVYLFLAGVLLQVLISLLNKWVNWYLYAYADLSGRGRSKGRAGKQHTSWSYALAGRISRQFWLDILADGGAVAAFGWATLKVLLIFTTT